MLLPQSVRGDAVRPKSKLQRALVARAGPLSIARLRKGRVHRKEQVVSARRKQGERRRVDGGAGDAMAFVHTPRAAKQAMAL